MVSNRLNFRVNRRLRYHLVAAITAATLVGGLAACTSPTTTAGGGTSHSSTGTSSTGGSGSITVGLAGAPDALDPTTGSTFVGRTVFANMCQKLYDINAQTAIVPQLAASLPVITDGGRTYTI
jgi:peptide/nickel transport system substrate-binding protein